MHLMVFPLATRAEYIMSKHVDFDLRKGGLQDGRELTWWWMYVQLS